MVDFDTSHLEPRNPLFLLGIRYSMLAIPCYQRNENKFITFWIGSPRNRRLSKGLRRWWSWRQAEQGLGEIQLNRVWGAGLFLPTPKILKLIGTYSQYLLFAPINPHYLLNLWFYYFIFSEFRKGYRRKFDSKFGLSLLKLRFTMVFRYSRFWAIVGGYGRLEV